MNFINKKNLANICGILTWFHNLTELFQHLSTTTFNGEQAKSARTGFRCLLSLCNSLVFFRNHGMLYQPTVHFFWFLFFFNLTTPWVLRVPLPTDLQTLYIPLTQGSTKFSTLAVSIRSLQEPMVETNCSLDPVL